MNRLEALKAAGDFVGGLLATTNARGFAAINMSGPERIEYTLRVAAFLLDPDATEMPTPARPKLLPTEDEW